MLKYSTMLPVHTRDCVILPLSIYLHIRSIPPYKGGCEVHNMMCGRKYGWSVGTNLVFDLRIGEVCIRRLATRPQLPEEDAFREEEEVDKKHEHLSHCFSSCYTLFCISSSLHCHPTSLPAQSIIPFLYLYVSICTSLILSPLPFSSFPSLGVVSSPNDQTSDLVLNLACMITSGGTHLMGNLVPFGAIYSSSTTDRARPKFDTFTTLRSPTKQLLVS